MYKYIHLLVNCLPIARMATILHMVEHFARVWESGCDLEERAAAAVEHKVPAVVSDAALHVVESGAAEVAVHLGALRGHALVGCTQLVPAVVPARCRESGAVHLVVVAVADERVQCGGFALSCSRIAVSAQGGLSCICGNGFSRASLNQPVDFLGFMADGSTVNLRARPLLQINKRWLVGWWATMEIEQKKHTTIGKAIL